MSLWYCPTCQDTRGPSPANVCPECGTAMSWTTVAERQADPARVPSVEPAPEPDFAPESSPGSSQLDLAPMRSGGQRWVLAICSKCSAERQREEKDYSACEVCRNIALEAEVDRLRAERREIEVTVAGYLDEHRTNNAIGMIHRLAGNLVTVVERLGEERRGAAATESRLRAREDELDAIDRVLSGLMSGATGDSRVAQIERLYMRVVTADFRDAALTALRDQWRAEIGSRRACKAECADQLDACLAGSTSTKGEE